MENFWRREGKEGREESQSASGWLDLRCPEAQRPEDAAVRSFVCARVCVPECAPCAHVFVHVVMCERLPGCAGVCAWPV